MDHQTEISLKGLESSYGLEVAPDRSTKFPEAVPDQSGLQYIPSQDPRTFGLHPYNQTGGLEYKTPEYQEYSSKSPTISKDGIHRKHRTCFWILAVLIFLIILSIGLGAGLGVHFSRGNSHSSSTLSSSSTPSSTTSSSATPSSSLGSGKCVQNTTYCGWYLINNASYPTTYLYSLDTNDPWDDLFLCSTDNVVTKSQSCGGGGTCFGPFLNKNGCSTATGQSCCYNSS